MRTKRKKIIIVLLLSFVTVTYLSYHYLEKYKNVVKNTLREYCVEEDEIPNKRIDAIYVMGGSQISLEKHYKIAALMYHKNICKKILILNRPGKTDEININGKKISNNDWSLKYFDKLGVDRKNIELLKIKPGFFGTLSEAKSVQKIVKARNYISVVFITSPSHTKRVKACFSKYLQSTKIAFYIIGSEDRFWLRDLIKEIIKNIVYKYFLL